MARNQEARVRFAAIAGLLAVLGVGFIGWWQAGSTVSSSEFLKGLYAASSWLGGLALRQWHFRESGMGFIDKWTDWIELSVMGIVSAFALYALLEYLLPVGQPGLYYSSCIPLGVILGFHAHAESWLLAGFFKK
jgi:hypothetical protein